jgi:hypothetical protein
LNSDFLDYLDSKFKMRFDDYFSKLWLASRRREKRGRREK